MHEHFLKYINITYPIINFPFYLHLLLLLLHQIFFFSSSHSSILSVCALWAKHTHKKKLFVQMLYTTAFPFAKPLALCTDDESRETKWKKKKNSQQRHQRANGFSFVWRINNKIGFMCTCLRKVMDPDVQTGSLRIEYEMQYTKFLKIDASDAKWIGFGWIFLFHLSDLTVPTDQRFICKWFNRNWLSFWYFELFSEILEIISFRNATRRREKKKK